MSEIYENSHLHSYNKHTDYKTYKTGKNLMLYFNENIKSKKRKCIDNSKGKSHITCKDYKDND